MIRTQDTVNQIAWLCGLNPEQFKITEFKRYRIKETVFSVFEEKKAIATISLLIIANSRKHTWELTFHDKTAKITFKPFIQMLKRLRDEDDINLIIYDFELKQEFLF